MPRKFVMPKDEYLKRYPERPVVTSCAAPPAIDIEVHWPQPVPGPRYSPKELPWDVKEGARILLLEGVELGGHEWYDNMYPNMQAAFGNYADFMVLLLAATSPMTGVVANATNAQKAFAQYCAWGGEYYEGFVDAHLQNVQRAAKGERLSGLKVENFAAAMFGNDRACAIDRWVARAFNAENANLDGADYFDIEYAIIELSEEEGLAPARGQAALWAGMKAMAENIKQFTIGRLDLESIRRWRQWRLKQAQIRLPFQNPPPSELAGVDWTPEAQRRLLEIAAGMLH